MIEKKAYEFELSDGEDQWIFLVVKVHGRDEPGWLNLYIFEDDGGDFSFVSSLDENVETAIDAAKDYVEREFEISRESLQEQTDDRH